MRTLSREVAASQSGQRRRPVLRYEPVLAKVSRSLVDLFELSDCDAETHQFLELSRNASVFKLLAADLLRMFMSRTTANGLVGRGGMFVLSNAQARRLLRPSNTPPEEALPLESSRLPFHSLLDIGAGDGGVTAKLAPLFETVYATEYSASMRWRLRRRGYTVLDHIDPFHDPVTRERRFFDVIACLNVLDRADTPLTLLREMRDSLSPNGVVLLAVVLPWCPFVEFGREQRVPSERLPMEGGECCKGASYEASVTKLVENVLQPCGFELVRWTRLPYLCEGNLEMEYALLNDAVFVLKRTEQTASEPAPTASEL